MMAVDRFQQSLCGPRVNKMVENSPSYFVCPLLSVGGGKCQTHQNKSLAGLSLTPRELTSFSFYLSLSTSTSLSKVNFILFISIIRILVEKLRCPDVGGNDQSQYRYVAWVSETTRTEHKSHFYAHVLQNLLQPLYFKIKHDRLFNV